MINGSTPKTMQLPAIVNPPPELLPIALEKGVGLKPQNSQELWQCAALYFFARMTRYQSVQEAFIAFENGYAWGFDIAQIPQTVAVINNTASVFGDGLPALMYAKCSGLKEWEEYRILDDERVSHPPRLPIDQWPDSYGWYCRISRQIGDMLRTVEYSFTVADAKIAGRWWDGKKDRDKSPWYRWPERMLRSKPLAWSIKDIGSDVLKNMPIYEEVIEIPQRSERTHLGQVSIDELTSIGASKCDDQDETCVDSLNERSSKQGDPSLADAGESDDQRKEPRRYRLIGQSLDDVLGSQSSSTNVSNGCSGEVSSDISSGHKQGNENSNDSKRSEKQDGRSIETSADSHIGDDENPSRERFEKASRDTILKCVCPPMPEGKTRHRHTDPNCPYHTKNRKRSKSEDGSSIGQNSSKHSEASNDADEKGKPENDLPSDTTNSKERSSESSASPKNSSIGTRIEEIPIKDRFMMFRATLERAMNKLSLDDFGPYALKMLDKLDQWPESEEKETAIELVMNAGRIGALNKEKQTKCPNIKLAQTEDFPHICASCWETFQPLHKQRYRVRVLCQNNHVHPFVKAPEEEPIVPNELGGVYDESDV